MPGTDLGRDTQLTNLRLKEIGAMRITDARLTTKGREAMGKALPACKISE